MGCFHPIDAHRSLTPKSNGKHTITFGSAPTDSIPQQLPCNQCIGCRLERSRNWAVRCMHEASLYENNCFLTLTYNDINLPSDGSIDVRHFQLFMKKLRVKFPSHTIRFFHCGEYGEQLGRPHYHACIFGFDFPDKILHSKSNGIPLFTSEILTKIWGNGHCSIGSVTFESAAYVARYIMKKITGTPATNHYQNFDLITGELLKPKKPEYITMSRKPGIAKGWFDKYKSDVYPSDNVIVNGHPTRPPKFYDTKLEESDLELFNQVMLEREMDNFELSKKYTPERLKAKETILKQNLKQLKRPFHDN